MNEVVCGVYARSGWFCPNCQKEVPGEHVTFEETHDPRCGGCGHKME